MSGTGTDQVGKKIIRVVAAVIQDGERYLITQRRPTAVLPLLWEFPGGKVEKGEPDENALLREMKERLDADVKVGRKLIEKLHDYDGYQVALALYQTILTSSKPLKAVRVNDFRWVGSEEFDKYEFPDADQKTMDLLLGV